MEYIPIEAIHRLPVLVDSCEELGGANDDDNNNNNNNNSEIQKKSKKESTNILSSRLTMASRLWPLLATRGRCLILQKSTFVEIVANMESKTSETLNNSSCYFAIRQHLQRRFSSSIESSREKGEELFQNAVQALKQAEKQKQMEEEQKSTQQYEAWERAQQRNPLNSGVAVIKTIAKQTRQARKEKEQRDSYWFERAQKLLEEAAFNHGHPKALVMLGNDALERARAEENIELIKERVLEAVQHYTKAGEENSAEGWFNLGHLLWTGYPNQDGNDLPDDYVVLQQNKGRAMSSFLKAIELGDSDAMYFIGVNNMSEWQEESESTDAMKSRVQSGLNFIQKAADLGHPGALHYLALFYYNGDERLSIPACSADEFSHRLDAATNVGDPEALFLRGHGYLNGDDGRSQDYQNALSDFIQAAEGEHSDAAVSAGAMLHQGIGGVTQDQRAAFELYQKAAELGNLEGWRNVVACYELGEGVPQCKQTAEYIRKTMLKEEAP